MMKGFMVAFLATLSLPGFAGGSPIAMPTDAQIRAATSNAIDGVPVCQQGSGLGIQEGRMEIVIPDERGDLPADVARLKRDEYARLQSMAQVLVKSGLAMRVADEHREDKRASSAVTVEVYALNDAGKAAFSQVGPVTTEWSLTPSSGTLCHAKRKVSEIVAFTSPAVIDGYTIVRVVYTWTRVEIASWAAALAESRLIRVPNGFPAAERDTLILIHTNKGWMPQTVFGSPIAK